ncbi:MAG: thioredoxin family protein [Gammaproteobacteria bacterium]|nr:thioredoxin family protein [Gammaproteobacteria bacterium]
MRIMLPLLLLGTLLAGCDVSPSVKVGQVAPSLPTKTLADVGNDFSQITTSRYPDERMYQYSLDEALHQGKPIVLEFATPGHCTVCDKQLQILKGLLAKYESDVIFLHMDQYKNPEAFKAFRVIGDPWTFVIDRQRVVQFKQAGRMLYGELDSAIARVLMQPAG